MNWTTYSVEVGIPLGNSGNISNKWLVNSLSLGKVQVLVWLVLLWNWGISSDGAEWVVWASKVGWLLLWSGHGGGSKG